jgi:hypothetical protein
VINGAVEFDPTSTWLDGRLCGRKTAVKGTAKPPRRRSGTEEVPSMFNPPGNWPSSRTSCVAQSGDTGQTFRRIGGVNVVR